MSFLEGLAEPDWRAFHSDSEVQNIAKSALELLKAQRETIDELISADKALKLKEQETQKFFVDESGKVTPLPVVVRCKDCIHYRYYGLDSYTVSECKIDHEENPEENWFCADGELEKYNIKRQQS